jgi:UDP-2-acetamido-3-amino-2,3-dideoxy-glucuronate N-acetyltransferase
MKKIAIIGLGKWGKNLLREFSKVSCVTKCHTRGNQKNISWLRKNYPKVIHTTRIKDILTDKNIDAVVISTPINSHFKIAKNALESGKHVFVEKPMANTIIEAKQLIKIAKSENLNLFVGHVFLYNEIFKKIKKIDIQESIIYAHFTWKKFGTFDEDIFKNLLSHDISLILELFGSPNRIRLANNIGFITASDRISLELNFTHHRKCDVSIDRISPYKEKSVAFLTKKNLFVWNDDKLLRFDKRSQSFKKIYQSKNTPLHLECKEFIANITNKKISYDSSFLALNVTRILSKLSR